MLLTMSHRLQRTEMTSKGNWTPTCWDSTRGGNIDWDLAKSVEHVRENLGLENTLCSDDLEE